MTDVVILGAGMAGFGAAHRLHAEGVRPVMFEQKAWPGGHTASFHQAGGFIFDDGPHISFTKDERIQQLFADSVKNEFETIHAYVNNHWKGQWIKHPAQCNLHGLPTQLVVDILSDMVAAKQQAQAPAVSNYAEWLVASFGRTFATTFPMEYGLKYHTTPAENMTTEWLGPRLYTPELREVFQGAVSPSTADVHYVSHFRYPTRNGFVSYLDGFLGHAEVRLEHQLTRLDPRARTLTFANGRVASYGQVVSSIPLPVLVPLIAGVPEPVLEAARQLACTQCVLVNLGVAREDISPAHWTYFYDRDFVFTRLSFPHMLSRFTVPDGCGSIQAELYYSDKYRPLDQPIEALVQPTIDDLQRCGLLRPDDRILFKQATLAPFANVIFDRDRPAALATVRAYLDEIGVEVCGRYGEWGYHWTDESFLSGEAAAQRALDRVTSGGVPA